jgi:hypothetical protein
MTNIIKNFGSSEHRILLLPFPDENQAESHSCQVNGLRKRQDGKHLKVIMEWLVSS